MVTECIENFKYYKFIKDCATPLWEEFKAAGGSSFLKPFNKTNDVIEKHIYNNDSADDYLRALEEGFITADHIRKQQELMSSPKLDGWRIAYFNWRGYKGNDTSKFPTVQKMMDFFGDDCLAIGFSLLEPNTFLYEHIDLYNVLGEQIRFHLVLHTLPGCYFTMNKKIVPLEVGEVYMLDTSKMHGAANPTNDFRLTINMDFVRSKVFV